MPLPLPPYSGVFAINIASGDSHTCAVVNGGKIKCWGANGSGQLGVWSTTQHNRPVDVSLGPGLCERVRVLAYSVHV